jgi:saccharopine dehydrogenase-like NADP-dependent oxidoreductase
VVNLSPIDFYINPIIMWIMKICILGCGLQGRVVAQDLNKNKHEVTILDSGKENLRKVDKSLNIKTKIFDVTNRAELIRFIKNFDVVVGALPAKLGFYSMQCAIEASVDMVDLSYSGEDPFLLDRDAKKKKIKIIPDAGFAPGLSNILIGETYRLWDKIDYLRILVGGMPINPIPPFNYQCTWSPADLIEEYTRPSRIIRNSKIVTVEALSGIEEFSISKSGQLECFYTDGLRTLLKTIKPVKNMEEKTIRYTGHAELLKSLIEYGFQPDSENPFTNPKIKPNRDILDFLNKQLNQGDDKDLSILIVELKKGNQTRKYSCIDCYDERNKITSMARMTAYTGSIITECIKDYPGFGVIAPEYLGMNKNICNFIKTEIKRRNIIIRSNTTLRAL